VGKAPEPGRFADLLRQIGFEQVEILPWWKLFDRVWARKPGKTMSTAEQSWFDILSCPTCRELALEKVSPTVLCCRACEVNVPISPDGIVLYYLDFR
jgi:hypothetical protein